MTVGARRPKPGAGAMTVTRGLGNLLIRAAFRRPDRAGEHRLALGLPRLQPAVSRQTVELRSAGFEIETELASEAVARGLRVVEIPVPYHPRIAGTESKLTGVPRRPADPGHDRKPELAIRAASPDPGLLLPA